MANPIKVTIAGREYSLLGEDEAVIKNAANEVNKQIEELKNLNEDEPSSTITILAALNIAEKFYKNRHQIEVDQEYIVSELQKMSEFLESKLSSETI